MKPQRGIVEATHGSGFLSVLLLLDELFEFVESGWLIRMNRS